MTAPKHAKSVYQLKVTLKDVQPPVWRRLLVKDCSLERLHDIIQAALGWSSSHLYAFHAGGAEYGEPDPDGMYECENARKMKLGTLVSQGVKKMTYVYDFGDNWEHTIQVEKELEPEKGAKYPRCTEGKRACPPEDCGGPWGYGELLEILADPKHEEHAERLEWLGGEFDPEKFDLDAVNEELEAIGG
jgi:hypothetical protein